jgi:hypothetical protein
MKKIMILKRLHKYENGKFSTSKKKWMISVMTKKVYK